MKPLLITALALVPILTPIAMADKEKPGAATPFNGRDLTGWEMKASSKDGQSAKWEVGTPKLDGEGGKALAVEEGGEGAALVNVVSGHGQGVDIYSKEKWGSSVIELEVLVAHGANSGIYVMGEYEVQVLDSFGKEKLGGGDMGAIYGAQPPRTNACKPAGEWQKYVIDFDAPKFDGEGKKVANAKFVKVELNGEILHENVEMKGPTPAGVAGKEAAEGPIMFQGDHGAAAFRNIRITPKSE